MARMNPDDRREAIIAATLAVMQRQGIAATTVRDVAAELGASSGLIHHYMTSMDELIAEAEAAGISGARSLNKAQLVDALVDAMR